MSSSSLPVAQRPLEYVAFFHVRMNTREGPAYVFLALDAYRDYVYNLGVYPELNDDVILKCIYELTEHEEFGHYAEPGFTIVMEDQHHLAPRINTIIGPMGGKLLFDKPFNNQLASPVLLHLMKSMQNRSE